MATNKTVIKKQTNKQTKTIKNHYQWIQFTKKTIMLLVLGSCMINC